MRTHLGLAMLSLLLAGGCADFDSVDYVTPARMDRGLVLILPGIEGTGALSDSVREGLQNAGLDYALKVYSWGRPIPLAGPLINQVDVIGNRVAGGSLAQLIVNYQDAHPGRPVYIVGHSGGGGVAVFAAESLPEGRKLDGLVLLSASLSSGYDLSKAMSHCRKGIVNFYSHEDVAVLMFGTTVVGNVDGGHGPSAGAVGFSNHFSGLYEIGWTQDMALAGNAGGHTDSADAGFIRTYISPWLFASKWPAGTYMLSNR